MNRGFPAARRSPARPAAAEVADIAAAALAFLAERPEDLADFFATTGLTPSSLRAAAQEAGFPRGILSFLAANETLLVLFAESQERDPAELGFTLQAVTGFHEGG